MTSVQRLTPLTLSPLLSIMVSVLFAACSTSPSPQTLSVTTVENPLLGPTSQALLRSIDISFKHNQPSELERNESLRTKIPSEARALVLSEAFYPTQDIHDSNEQNRNAIRSAHFAYEGILSERCRASANQICDALAIQYSKVVRFIVEDLALKRWDTKSLSSSEYDVSLNGDGGSIDLNEWNIQLSDRENAPRSNKEGHHAIGSQAAACRTSPATNGSPLFTSCLPIELVVTFEASTDAPYARAFVTAVDTHANDRIRLGDADFALIESPSQAWESLSLIIRKSEESRAPHPGHLACLGEVDPKRISALFMPDSIHTSAPWVEIATALSTDPEIAERYNFCLYSDDATEISAQSLKDLTTSIILHLGSPKAFLSAISPPRVVFITQGDHSGDLVTAVRATTKMRGRERSSDQFETTGLFAISPHLFLDNTPANATNSSLSVASSILVAQNDIKHLLTKIDEQHAEEELENSLPDEIDLSVSPIM